MRYNTSQINMNFSDSLIEENPEIITCGEFFAGGGGWTEEIHHIPNVQAMQKFKAEMV